MYKIRVIEHSCVVEKEDGSKHQHYENVNVTDDGIVHWYSKYCPHCGNELTRTIRDIKFVLAGGVIKSFDSSKDNGEKQECKVGDSIRDVCKPSFMS